MSLGKHLLSGNRTGHIATVSVILLAFLATISAYIADLDSPSGPPFSGTAMAVASVLGVVYLWLMVTEPRGMTPYLGRHAKWVTFTALVILMLIIEYLLAGSNSIWLISMPLVATATVELSPKPRWLIYFLVLFGIVAPFYLLYHSLEASFLAAINFSPAIIFVIIFISLTQSAERAQQKAEDLALQLAEVNNKLSQYAVQAEELATIQERNRLAREIHDNLGHYLTVVNVQIKAAQALMNIDPAKADIALEKAGQLSQEGLAAVRQSVSALRESPFGQRTLHEAISVLAAETQAAGIVAEFTTAGMPRPLQQRAELTLYRATQEGLTNVRKHARASRVDITLDYQNPDAVSLSIYDNGIGIADAGHAAGFGLLGIQERVKQVGGRIDVSSAPGEGFCLHLELPAALPIPAEGADQT